MSDKYSVLTNILCFHRYIYLKGL